MAEPPDRSIENAHAHGVGTAVNAADVEAWFVREVLPLETTLMQFLSHNWRHEADIADIRQDVYEQVCEAAQEKLPENTKAFVFRTARNLIIDRFRHEQVVSIEAVPDLEAFEVVADLPGPERSAVARSELRRVEAAVDSLPPRCREAIVLGRIEGLSAREIATRMGITEQAVSKHLKQGIRALADLLYGDASNRRSSP
jgi:RNA polymerase sigma-70 factor (ECF subfamily)